MARPSKEHELLDLFFNYPSKVFRFKELKQKTTLPDNKIVRWLKTLQEQKIIIKNTPYYKANNASAEYKNTKQLYAWQNMHSIGLLNHLYNTDAITIILFGSFSRSDWHNESDIDIFMYGAKREIDLSTFEKKIGRNIQIISVKNSRALIKLNPYLLNNIVAGDLIKGTLSFIDVKPHVKIQHSSRKTRTMSKRRYVSATR